MIRCRTSLADAQIIRFTRPAMARTVAPGTLTGPHLATQDPALRRASGLALAADPGVCRDRVRRVGKRPPLG
jgi:hypothetical protein